MKTAKLVTGILCMVFTMLVLFQSCAAGIGNALAENGEVSGTAGAFLAILMLSGGIVQVATRNSKKKGGSIASLIIFALAAILGFANAGSYADLNVWAGWCLILAVLNAVCIFKTKGEDKEQAE